MIKSRKSLLVVLGVLSVLILTLGLLIGTDTALAAKGGNVIGPGGYHYITKPGNYKVQGTVLGISVDADNVHINLSQGTVACRPSQYAGIRIRGRNVRVNGSLTGVVTNCEGAGIVVTGYGCQVNGVVVRNNGHGVQVVSSKNHVNGNDVRDNAAIGIYATGLDNHINGNTALGNNYYDLYDYNASCDNNKWNSNAFDTSNQACIN